MAFVIDEIWYLRNCSLHNGNQPNIQPSSLRNRDRTLEFSLISQSNSQTLRPLINTCWTPPPQDWIKENVHAAISTSSTGLAAIARDHAGEVIHVWTEMHKPCSPLQAEAFALVWAVQQSSLKGWRHVIFESDSK
ncbi:hypothetical protein SO802_005370 [Lithocarpus litseifolius]|uniref:RNase H type-1 domain-containing protein n=1 Tax=Lithocarpus litseifolius TaxID=425828 RepID=A0AAW2DKJ4_9ROSI